MTATVEPTNQIPDADPELLGQLVGRIIGDAGALATMPLALIGDRLGLFITMASTGPVTAAELAERTGLTERYLREWLLAMAASGYITYVGDASADGVDPRATARYQLSPEQREAFTNPNSPAFVAGMFQNMTAGTRMVDRLTEAFRTGAGIGWHEHHEDMFTGTERFFRPGYLAHLTAEWIPALTGIEARLQAGGQVGDVGCGLGASTIIMAQAYPNSHFLGLDYHDASIGLARQRAEAAGVTTQVEFRQGAATQLLGEYDLIAFFDCLHDMPDPMGALRTARSCVRPDGRVMLVEPMSWDTVEEALNPLGRVLAGASMLICLPSGMSAEPAAALGNQAGPARTTQLAKDAGFSDARVAASTDFNLIYELIP